MQNTKIKVVAFQIMEQSNLSGYWGFNQDRLPPASVNIVISFEFVWLSLWYHFSKR